MEVKKKQESGPILLELNGAVHNQRVEVFSQEGYGVLCHQGRLCVPDVGELRQHILAEAPNSRYFILAFWRSRLHIRHMTMPSFTLLKF